MKTLYISDLDGTLLNGEAVLSEYTIEAMNTLLKQGIHFSIATARSAATVTRILEPLDLKVPVVLMNGVLIYDISLKQYLKIHYITQTAFTKVTEILKKCNLTGFLYEICNNTMNTYYERLDSDSMRDFYEERVNKYKKSFIQVPYFSKVDSKHVIYFSLLDTKKHLDTAYQMLQGVPDIATAYYKDIYCKEDTWYLEIFSIKATKYNAVKYLRSQYQYDRIIGFGDNLNDLPLFKACDESCAVANAKEEVKALATHIIGSNQMDGVAHWLTKNVATHTNVYKTNLGYIGITENGTAITDLFYCKDQIPTDIIIEETPLLKEASQQLLDYLQGTRTDFTVPLAPEGTAFQKKVWNALQTIPYGETWSYKRLAQEIGNPKACRAVGMANNRNPIAIMIPCHRVVGANGKLVGYAGGLDIKEQLLRLETIK